MGTYARGVELAELLDAAGVPVTTEIENADAKRPCVLIGPPTLAIEQVDVATWTLAALAGSVGSSVAWRQLDELVDAVSDVLPIEAARPSTYLLHPDGPPIPCYLLDLTESIN